MKPKVYIETSIASYLTSEPSRDLVTAARQQITHDWWSQRREDFDLYVSEFVITEASRGNAAMARRRLDLLANIPEIELTEEAASLAERLVGEGPLPSKAAVDALHIAVSVEGGVDYLLTWNFKHLANAIIRRKIENACRSAGYEPCAICTPEELLEE